MRSTELLFGKKLLKIPKASFYRDITSNKVAPCSPGISLTLSPSRIFY